MQSVQKECTQYCPTEILCCPQNRDFENLISLHVTRLKTDFLLTYLTEGGVMTKNSQSSRSFLSFLSENRRPAKRKSVLVSPVIQKFKCACSAIQRG